MNDENRGLYSKYSVSRLNDEAGKHDDCFYFVLDLTHDEFAKMALVVYAMQCRKKYPALADDLLEIAFGAGDEGASS